MREFYGIADLAVNKFTNVWFGWYVQPELFAHRDSQDRPFKKGLTNLGKRLLITNNLGVLSGGRTLLQLRSMEAIQDWLAGEQNYTVGRAIYNAFGEDVELKALFEDGPTEWNRGKLLQALQELANGTVAKTENDEYGEMPIGGNDGVLNALREEWQEPYKVMQYKIKELDRYPNDDASSIAIREKLAFEILELEQQCMAIWTKRDYYGEHGKLPDTKETAKPVLTDPLAIARRINSLKRNIRRNKQKATDQPAMAHYPLLVQRDEAELEALVNGAN